MAIFFLFTDNISAIVILQNKAGFLTAFDFAQNLRVHLFSKQNENKIMKTKSLLFAVLVWIGGVASAIGKDEPRMTGMTIVPVKGSEVFKVIYRGESVGKVKLNIYNSKTKLILTETFNGVDGFICPLNFAGLDTGEYTIELVDAAGKKVEKITYTTKRSIQHVHINKIDNETGKYLLSVVYTPFSANEINIKIYDSKDNLVHTEVKEIKGDFAQVYKLKDKFGSYTFEVSDRTGKIKTIRF
jgi:hypothetical protein